MKAHNRLKTPSTFWFCILAALLMIAPLALIESFQGVQAASGDSAAVTYSHGAMHATIPYQPLHAGAGQLIVEVLDPEDNVLGRSERNINVVQGKGLWQEDLKLTKTIPVDELAWDRLRYRFTYTGQTDAALQVTESISEILRSPVIHILGQQSYLSGGAAGVRVIVTDSKNEQIPGASTVRIDLLVPERKGQTLFAGRLNRRGTAEAQFHLPPGLVGAYSLRYVVDTPIGSTEFTQPVRLEDKASILLTTEKPIYQPGQTIHVRALALDRANHEATADRSLTFEVEDSRGNKVFKKATQTDKFGIASAEFSLADEVNLGTYHLRALMGKAEESATNTAEIALNVERYVLPKFKVVVDMKNSEGKAKHGYRPGDHVTGTVRANYFFGKPVDNAEISVKATAMDVALFEAASVQGKTTAEGEYRFDIKLPAYFAGRPLSQGADRVLIEAAVKDGAGHSETRGEPITVSQSPLIIMAVPEGGTLIPNLENQVFILTSYADGKPAPADLTVHFAGKPDQNVSTDQGGVAVIRIQADGNTRALQVEASDKEGNRVSTSVPLQPRDGSDQILLRIERAVFRAGDRIQLKVLSTRDHGSAYIDVVKEGQTILTRDLDIKNGQAELTLTATPEMAGTIDFNAYQFGQDARPVGDHRLAFIQPADELKIEATSDAPAYKPGADARIRFRVTNAKGEGVRAALGLQIVDEAVFALAEKQPGFAKVFFYLEQEVMKPRYEIHSIGMPDIVEPVGTQLSEQRDRAARALFSATEIVSANKFETEYGRAVPTTKYAEYSQRYQARFANNVRELSKVLNHAYADKSAREDLTRVVAKVASTGQANLHDAWGGDLRVQHVPYYPQGRYYAVTSAGPDKRFDTGDDLTAYLEVHTGKVVKDPGSRLYADKIDFNIEHNRGPFNGLAEIAGSVTDASGAPVSAASIEAFESASGKTRKAKTNEDGQFSIAGLTPGTYVVDVTSAGFRLARRDLTISARDRAVLTAVLSAGAVNEIVTVEMNAAPLRMKGGFAGGVPGGVIGGVLGGVLGGARGEMLAEDRAMPMPASPMSGVSTGADAAVNLKFKDAKSVNSATLAKPDSGSSSPHVRSYFPEALYINPEIITDQDGRATIAIPMADSITTWRMAMVASTVHGALGTGSSSLKVFQDFFVDLDLPLTLTQGDRVSIPVAIYNYSGASGNVNLQLKQEDWFSLVDDAAEKTLTVESDRVGGSQFTVEAKRIGKFKLTLASNMKGQGNHADIVVREIEVIPNGREQNTVFNGRLENTVQHAMNFPPASIPDASKIFVRLYPGPLSQVVEGMDSILRMPGGCFEQTSSSTYPNVLALDYMKRTKKLTPEVHAKAEGYIGNGYQRLLTFEVPGGGFSWFGQAPANKILTSYGLMEFYDMSKVHDVDPKLIQRTQIWLASQQQQDGSWKPDTNFINEGATNRFNTDVLRITAYIAWALENSGYQGPAVENAKRYIQQHMSAKADAYTLAVLANFAVDYAKDREFTGHAMQLLVDAHTEKDEQAWWTAEETNLYATGPSAAIETTGLAVQALLKWGQGSAISHKALSYIAAKKDSSGMWGTTQATIMALRALLLSTEKGAADVRGTLEVVLNGKTAEKLTLTSENNDLLHQFVFKGSDTQGPNTVELRFNGKGGLAYQVVGRYFVPWNEKPANEPMSIEVAYDRTQLAQSDIATATATVKNNLPKSANMVMVDLGIPPGFDLLSEDLQAFQEKTAGQKGGKLEKFSLTATQAILYFDSINAQSTVKVHFRLRAKYPIRAKTFQSRVYEYYDPEVNSVARPVQLEVRKR